MAGVNKADLDALYELGLSIPEVSKVTGVPKSTVRFRLKAQGILRTCGEGVRNAGHRGRLGSAMRGKSRVFSYKHCENLSRSKLLAAEKTAKGVSLKPNGYVEYTRGEHKGRLVHVVMMEKRIGRHLHDDEVVHHIDGDKQNNAENNLALCTRSGHTRLHRREEKLSKKGANNVI